MAQAIWEGILDAFAAEDGIDLAYPTRRIFSNVLEGKEGARAELPEALGGGAASGLDPGLQGPGTGPQGPNPGSHEPGER